MCYIVSCLLFVIVCVFFFFFKQKTAYEMRISDWSSDVCSSDLKYRCHPPPSAKKLNAAPVFQVCTRLKKPVIGTDCPYGISADTPALVMISSTSAANAIINQRR